MVCLLCSVASYAAKALKMLILDDALRPQAANVVPGVVCDAVLYWEDEVYPCHEAVNYIFLRLNIWCVQYMCL